MTAEDSTPGNGESASGEEESEQMRLAARYAEVYDSLRFTFMEAGLDIENGEADSALVEELREEIEEATEAVDELAEFVEEE